MSKTILEFTSAELASRYEKPVPGPYFDQFAKFDTDAADLKDVLANPRRVGYNLAIEGRYTETFTWNEVRQNLLKTDSTTAGFMTSHWLAVLCQFHNRRLNPTDAVRMPRYICLAQDVTTDSLTSTAGMGLYHYEPGIGSLNVVTDYMMRTESVPAGLTSLQFSQGWPQVEHIVFHLKRGWERKKVIGQGHSILLIISPMNKTVEFFDALHLPNSELFISAAFEWIMLQLSASLANNNSSDPLDMTEWCWRTNRCYNQNDVIKRSGRPQQQSRGYSLDCCMHTAINAYNVLFGCYTDPSQVDLDQALVQNKRSRMLIEICKERLSIQGQREPSTYQMTRNDYTGKELNQAGEWVSINRRRKDSKGRDLPFGKGWTRFSWFEKCKWSAKFSRIDPRGAGFEYTMKAAGVSRYSTVGAIINTQTELRRRVLRDIAIELQIPEASDMSLSKPLSERWTRRMIRYRIDFYRMHTEGYYSQMWATVREKDSPEKLQRSDTRPIPPPVVIPARVKIPPRPDIQPTGNGDSDWSDDDGLAMGDNEPPPTPESNRTRDARLLRERNAASALDVIEFDDSPPSSPAKTAVQTPGAATITDATTGDLSGRLVLPPAQSTTFNAMLADHVWRGAASVLSRIVGRTPAASGSTPAALTPPNSGTQAADATSSTTADATPSRAPRPRTSRPGTAARAATTSQTVTAAIAAVQQPTPPATLPRVIDVDNYVPPAATQAGRKRSIIQVLGDFADDTVGFFETPDRRRENAARKKQRRQ